MRTIRITFVLCAFAALFLLSAAFGAARAAADQGKRVALVVGNGAYQHAPKIVNPRNDAEDVAAALRKLGFSVMLRLDIDKRRFQEALEDFSEWAESADAALFYYAGQGLEADGVNWLGPVDMDVKGPSDIAREMQPLNDAIAALQRSSGVKIAIVDACRDNPFEKQGQPRGISVEARKGLARVERVSGMAIIMSTSPGQTAEDGTGRNSPFAEALLTHIATPDLDLMPMMQRVIAGVVRATAGRQQPFSYVDLKEEFYFRRSTGAPQLSIAVQTEQMAEEVWKFIGSTKDPEQLKSFVINYPASRHIAEANERIAALAAAQEKLKAAANAPQKRVALVIGNGEYQHSRPLKNPENDARAVAAVLQQLGFDVRMELNLDKRAFDDVMPEFAAAAAGAEIALVYFSGHAIEFQGAAYVMPVDARPISRSHIRNQLKSVRDIVFDLENTAGLKLVVVDGCRDNPLASKLFGMLGLPRSTTGEARGFSLPDTERQQLGELIIAFATLQGEVAYDGGAEPNSPFTGAFLKHVEDAGIDVDQLFRIVKDEVLETTKGTQNPAIESYRGQRPFVLRAAAPQPSGAK